MSYDYWTLDQDPIIDDLRDDPRFIAMKQELDHRIELMRRNVEQAEATGDWNALLGRVRGSMTAAL